MRKTFMGVRLKTLREQRGITQAALAQLLNLSPSYVNQLENNQRPLSAQVLLRLQSALEVDLQLFSEDEEARLIAQLQEVVADSGSSEAIPDTEVRTLAQQMPGIARRLIQLHRQARQVQERLDLMGENLGERHELPSLSPVQAHEEVRDFFYAHSNYIADLDKQAEALHEALHPGDATGDGAQARDAFASDLSMARNLACRLEAHLAQAHGVRTLAIGSDGGEMRRFDPKTGRLWLDPAMESGQRAFQLATQLAYLEAGGMIDWLAETVGFRSSESRPLVRIGLSSYFAGALILPYRRFLAAAEAMDYDIDLLAQRFGVSYETACHRLSTLQRPGARGVPFFFVRVDRAGNISKRQSATDFHFSRTGGTCPLWNVYEAFDQPGKVLTQLASMPDGRTYLWIARAVVRSTGGFGAPARSFAIGLGCDLRHASRLVYAKGLALDDLSTATPIGPGCKVCDRQGCTQRAFPALGRPLRVNQNERLAEPYASVATGHSHD